MTVRCWKFSSIVTSIIHFLKSIVKLKSHPASEVTGTSWNQFPTSCSLSYWCLEIDHGWSAYNRHIDRQYILGLCLHFLKTSYWTFTNTPLGYLHIALHLNLSHTHMFVSHFLVWQQNITGNEVTPTLAVTCASWFSTFCLSWEAK